MVRFGCLMTSGEALTAVKSPYRSQIRILYLQNNTIGCWLQVELGREQRDGHTPVPTTCKRSEVGA